ncbi:MAG TPA: hypothetical protein VFQ61_18160 [Polyangiaceae bacterium]|nr:hypothetical protein [Polyangiaceae bacterium]
MPKTIVTRTSATSIPELYEEAWSASRAGEHARAAELFEKVYSLEPEGPLADDALFQSAAESDAAALLEAAASKYRELWERYRESPLSGTAAVRALRILVHLEALDRAEPLARQLLDGNVTLLPGERVVVRGALALSALARDAETDARRHIEEGRNIVDAQQLDSADRVSPDLAPLYFALGELRRRLGDRIVFEPMPVNFPAALEQRCQHLLDAQSAYLDAIRARDAHWSAMAGFRVGELYQTLHRDLMKVTPPASADTEAKRQLFEGAMRVRYSILLTKARAMLEHTLAMAERTAEHSRWVDRAREASQAIQRAVEEENAALDRLPYSRETLAAALADLEKRSAEKAATNKAGPVKPGSANPGKSTPSMRP